MSLFCDDKLTISITNNHVKYDRIKHINIDQNFIKKKLDNRLITITYTLYGFI